MKKRIIISVLVLIILLGAGALYIRQSADRTSNGTAGSQGSAEKISQPSQAEAEKVFRNYLIKYAGTSAIGNQESYEGTGVKASSKGVLDINSKKFTLAADMSCSGKVGQGSVDLDASMQIENDDTYIRLNGISGTIESANGVLYLSDTFAKVKNVWYKAPVGDDTIGNQLDAGIMLSSSAVYAPAVNGGKLADALLTNKAFTFSLLEKRGDKYEYTFRADRANYLAAVKQMFPDLKDPESAVSTYFNDKESLDSTLTILRDGTLIEERTTQNDLCRTIFKVYLGVDAEDLPAVLTGTSQPRPASSIRINPVSGAKPANEMGKDLTL